MEKTHVYDQSSPYHARKGYVVPPQDMPPKGGFFFPKYRMSTLMAKGLTTYQIVGSFLGLWAFGYYAMIQHSQWRNARVLSTSAQFVAQQDTFNILYGPPSDIDMTPNPAIGRSFSIPVPYLAGVDKRPEAFIGSVMASERQAIVNRFRQATRDAAVAPYQVCYGPEHYPHHHHICTKYCIAPEEVRNAKELIKMQADKSTNKSPGHHH